MRRMQATALQGSRQSVKREKKTIATEAEGKGSTRDLKERKGFLRDMKGRAFSVP